MNSYEKIDKVGEGTYGVVYKARHLTSGKMVALKKIALDSDPEGIPSTALREIVLLRSLSHANVVDLMDVIHVKDRLYMVFEYLDMDLKILFDRMGDQRLASELVRGAGLPPGVHSLPDFKSKFPKWRRKDDREIVPDIQDHSALSLIFSLVCYDPPRRMSAKAAVSHRYFDAFDLKMYPVPDVAWR